MLRACKKICKRALKALWLLFGAPSGLRDGEAVIVAAHRLAPEPADCGSDPLCTPMAVFTDQLDRLGRVFHWIALPDLLAMTPSERQQAGKLCVLTLDDGWADNYSLGLPVFAERGIPATIFLCTAMAGTDRRFWWEELTCLHSRFHHSSGARQEALLSALERELPGCSRLFGLNLQAAIAKVKKLHPGEQETLFSLGRTCLGCDAPGRSVLNWEEIRAMREAGCCFGGHGRRHAILPLLDDAEAEAEVRGCFDDLQSLLPQEGPRYFSYPNGDSCERDARLARESGFAAAVSMRPGIVPPVPGDLFSLPRVDVAGKRSGDDLLFAIWLCAFKARLRNVGHRLRASFTCCGLARDTR